MSQEQKIGRYIVKNILGKGAMGSVFKAHDPNLQRWVAIKMMQTGKIQKTEDYLEFKNRFFLEVRISGRLNHPNIVAVYDSGLHGEEPFLVMEFIDGRPLDAFIKDNYDESLNAAVEILEQIADGLDYAHEEGVIHRDIKPGNILVTTLIKPRQFFVKLLDFGLGKLNDSNLTQPGAFLGTPSYSSPEQILSGEVDTRSDIYSLGTVAYELITGKLPFHAKSLHAILYEIAQEPAKLDFSMFDEVMDTEALEAIFSRVFDKDPEKRFQTAREFVAELSHHTDPLKAMKRPPRTAASGAGKKKKVPVADAARTTSKQEGSPELATQPMGEAAQPTAMDKKHLKLVAQTRHQFSEAYKAKNLSSTSYCLKELLKLGADVTVERDLVKKLEALVEARKEKERQKNLPQLIKKSRGDFRLALETKNIASVRFCLKHLEDLGADVSSEKEAQTNLLRELWAEEARREKEKYRRERASRVRVLFKQAVKLQNLSDSEQYLEELEQLAQDVSKEKKHLQSLKEKLGKEMAERESWIRKTRVQFKNALKDEKIELCRRLITELESLLKVDAREEKVALETLIERNTELERQAREAQFIRRIREQFASSLAAKNLKECHNHLRELRELGAEVAEEHQQLTRLEQQTRKTELRKLKGNMILHTREKFEKSLEERNVDLCDYYLKELRQLTDDVQEQEQALKDLEKRQLARETARLRRQMVENARAEFLDALKHRDLKQCGFYLKELLQLKADVSFEIQATDRLDCQIRAEEELQAKMIQQSRQEFLKGIHQKDIEHCKHFLRVLEGFGAEVVEEKRQLDHILSNKKTPSLIERETSLKAKMIEQFRSEFMTAFRSGDITACRNYLIRLKQLNANVDSESEAFHMLHPRNS